MTQFPRAFVLYLCHGDALPGIELPNGRVIVFDDPEGWVSSGAPSADALCHGYAGARIEWADQAPAEEHRADAAEAERNELHDALGLAPGQLHSAALSAILGRAANIRELTTRAEQAERRAHEAEQALHALRGVTDTDRADKAEKRGDHWKAKAQEIEADRDQLRLEVTRLADALLREARAALAVAVEVHDPCPHCGDQQLIPRYRMAEHVARLHPDEQQGPAVSGGDAPTTRPCTDPRHTGPLREQLGCSGPDPTTTP